MLLKCITNYSPISDRNDVERLPFLKFDASLKSFRSRSELESRFCDGEPETQLGSFAITSDNSFNMLSKLSMDLVSLFETEAEDVGTVRDCCFDRIWGLEDLGTFLGNPLNHKYSERLRNPIQSWKS